MNLFNRFRRQGAAGGNPIAAQPDTVVVPPRHKVEVVSPSPFPGVQRSSGGVWLACQGSTSDEPVEELEKILQEVENKVYSSQSQVLMSTAGGSISNLFAPAQPVADVLPGALLWVLDPAVLVSSIEGPRFLQLLFRKMYTISIHIEPTVAQIVYVSAFASPAGQKLAELVSHLGIVVRGLDPATGGLLAEVHRPEGIILSALLGMPFVPKETADNYWLQINQEKDLAETQADDAKFRRLEENERREITGRLASLQGAAPGAVSRATRLQRLLLELDRSDPAGAWQAVCEELLQRELPLLVIVDPKTGGAPMMKFPSASEEISALPAYTDTASLMKIAKLGLPFETLASANMSPRKLFKWMAGQHSAVAINYYRDDAPFYLHLRPEEVKALAEGKVPKRSRVFKRA